MEEIKVKRLIRKSVRKLNEVSLGMMLGYCGYCTVIALVAYHFLGDGWHSVVTVYR